jgi:hypothetical protein
MIKLEQRNVSTLCDYEKKLMTRKMKMWLFLGTIKNILVRRKCTRTLFGIKGKY